MRVYQTDISIGDSRIEVKTQDILPIFQANEFHHFFYGQFLLAYYLHKFYDVWIIRVQLVLYLSCTCGVLVGYLRGSCSLSGIFHSSGPSIIMYLFFSVLFSPNNRLRKNLTKNKGS